MAGLLLTNYYLVYRSFLAYTGIALAAAGLLIYFGDITMYRLAAMLIILLMAMPALEVIKVEAKTGFDKYVLTLPVSRIHIVQSHYFFYLFVAILGIALSHIVLYIYGEMSGTGIGNIFSIASWGTFIVLFAGAIAFPLLYLFGAEKSDSIVLGGSMGGLLVLMGLQGFVDMLMKGLSLSTMDPTLLAATIYLVIGLVLYVISYFVALYLYRKKEF